MKIPATRLLLLSALLFTGAISDLTMVSAHAQAGSEERIDFDRARELIQKRRGGGKLTPEEEAYVQRAMQARRDGATPATSRPEIKPRQTVGLKPLTELTAGDRYKDLEGGLYGAGRNTPRDPHRKAAETELAKIQPLDAAGKPVQDGKFAFISISMSNATQEFSEFKRRADADPAKSPSVVIVDCAQGGQAMAEWVNPSGPPWREAERRIAAANLTDEQVQVAWVKLANKGPRGDLREHGDKLRRDTLAVLQNAKTHFPNLRVVYLGSRIYAGYAGSALNPEPYAYESAFVCRWLIQDQINGDPALNYDPARGPVKAPLLLWGPYFWADGTTPRQSDGLIWNRADFANDGTHPSQSGREKVARLLLDFCKTDPLAKPWFTRK
jgi:hypothetical protein